jgi:hypothetical protein
LIANSDKHCSSGKKHASRDSGHEIGRAFFKKVHGETLQYLY